MQALQLLSHLTGPGPGLRLWVLSLHSPTHPALNLPEDGRLPPETLLQPNRPLSPLRPTFVPKMYYGGMTNLGNPLVL